MSNTAELVQQASFAQAAYASGLFAGMTRVALESRLVDPSAGFAATQATSFSADYDVFLQYNDTFAEGGLGTGLSLTVFRDRANNALTLALRGTEGIDGPDLLITDTSIFASGAGYDQIVALANWWRRASTSGGMAAQYLHIRDNELYPDAIPLGDGYLARGADVAATGELVSALTAAGGGMDITGHSLGGHLAMAFQSLFPASSRAVSVFNAPGFLTSSENEAFFQTLGGAGTDVPAGDVPGLFNVVADHTSAADVPFQGIAMLHSRPGLAVDVPIEDQRIAQELLDTPPALNHSQMVLTDALAVRTRVERLQPSLTHAQMSTLLAQSANQEHAGLERVVDALQALLGIDTAPLPTGHDEREALYLALKGIDEHPALASMAGQVTFVPAFDPQAARTDFAALLSLTLGLPFQVRTDDYAAMDALGQVHAEAYAQWTQDVAAQLAGQTDAALHVSDAYLRDRAAMLGVWAGAYTRDADVSYRPWLTRATVYEDKASGVSMLDAPNATASVPLDIVRFGAGGSGTLEGGYGDDRLYGGGGADTLLGQEGDDRLEGQSGNDNLQGGAGRDTLIGGTEDDTLNGGRDNDELIGGSGVDTYRFGTGFGHDTVIDADGLGVLLDGEDHITGGKRVPGQNNVWADEAGRYTFTLVDAAPGRQDLVIGKRGSGTALAGQITVRGWLPGQLGITLQGDELPVTPVDNTLTGGFIKKLEDDGETYVIAGGNYVADGVDPAAQDLIFGGSGADALFGGDGNDALSGRDGDDDIDGGDGHDLLLGGAGSDRIRGGAGNDHIYGSAWGGVTMPEKNTDAPPVASGVELARGFGWVVYNPPGDSGGRDVVTVTADINAVAGDGGNWIDAGAGDDAVAAGSGADVVLGGAGRDKIDGMHGADVLDGGDDDDILYGDGVADPALAAYTPFAAHGDDVLSGGAGADQLIGQGGDDVLYGGIGNDKLFGDQLASLDGQVDDTPLAYHGADVLDGGEGDDYLEGDGGSDRLLGGDGADMLWGDATPDRLDKSAHGDDVLDGGAGNDTLIGGGGHDALYGGDGNDALAGDDEASSALDADAHGNDMLDGGLGNDTLFGGGGHDVLLGGAGDDFLSGDDATGVDDAGTLAGNDVLEGGAGNDVLIGGLGDDVLLGGDGNDVLAGGAGANVLEGGAGDDQYHLSSAADVVVEAAGAGHDTIVANLSPAAQTSRTATPMRRAALPDKTALWRPLDEPVPGVPNLVLPANVEQAVLQGTANVDLTGNDDDNLLQGNDGDNRISGGGGRDQISGGGGHDVLDGGAGADALNGGAGNDVYIAALATVDGVSESIVADAGQDHLVLSGVVSADLTVTWRGSTKVLTLADASGQALLIDNGLRSSIATVSVDGADIGMDRFLGENLATSMTASTVAAGDTLLGGKASDTLTVNSSHAGSLVSAGRGDDTVKLNSAGGAVLRFWRGDGVDKLTAVARTAGNPAALNVLELGPGIEPAQLRLVWRSNGSHTLVLGEGDGLTFTLSAWTVPTVPPSAGWPIDRIRFAGGQEETLADVLARGVYVTPTATAGDDTLTLTPAADTFYAMAGHDTIDGADGNDKLYGEAGNDRLTGGRGNDILNGGTDNDELFGGEGDDQLDGGASTGADTLHGGAGRDTYIFASGQANAEDDAVSDDTYRVSWINSGGSSARRFSISDFGGADTIVSTTSSVTPDSMVVRNTGSSLEIKSGNYSNSNVLTLSGVIGTDGNIDATRMVERLTFGNGVVWSVADIVARSLVATTGSDTLRGYGGNDDIDGLAGNDRLYGSFGDDVLRGGSGSDWLYGEAGNDTLLAGPGGAYVAGGLGDDRYIVAAGDGSVTITPTLAAGTDAGQDTLELGVLRSQTTVSVAENWLGSGLDALTIRFNDGTATAAVQLKGRPDDVAFEVDLVRFADGQTVTLAELLAPFLPVGTQGADALVGTSLDDVLAGAGGDDLLDGRAGDDVLEGGAGNDVLMDGAGSDMLAGGAGNDSVTLESGDDLVLFGLGDGHDTVSTSTRSGISGTKTLVLGAGIDQADIEMRWVSAHDEGNTPDLIQLTLRGSGESVTWDRTRSDSLSSDYESAPLILDGLRFADGTFWDRAAMLALANTGTVGDDLLIDDLGFERLEGGAGNDFLNGKDGDDLLLGGTGADTLIGGFGDDELVGGLGDDRLDGGQGQNLVRYALGDGHDTIERYYGPKAASVTLALGEGIAVGDVTFARDFGGGAYTHGLWLGFADGGSIRLSDVTRAELLPEGIEFASGESWSREEVAARATTGTELADLLMGFHDTGDAMLGGAGDDTLWGLAGSDVIDGGDGNDVLHAVGGSASYRDGIGTSDDRDTLVGGTGNDQLYAGDGHVAYRFGAGFGQDTLRYSAERNGNKEAVVSFLEGIDSSDIVLTRLVGNTLAIGAGAHGEIRVEDAFGAGRPVTRIEFADGSGWTYDDIMAKVASTATSGNDTIVGTGAADILDGLQGDDSLYGDAGDDRLFGSQGNDDLHGGDGQDLLEGGAGDDVLQGGAGSDTLHGGGGVDAMIGGAGDDLYYVDAAGDTTVESAGEGVDTVRAAISWVLSSEVENLELLGGVALQATGNALDNVLRGNAGDNLIDGGAGADTLFGGAGNDTYVVDHAGDTVFEAAGEGVDLVQTRISFVLPDHVENLTLLGTAAATVGTGNALDNVLTGNGQANTLYGGAGNDWLNGGSGNDTMHGGEDDDSFVVNAGGDVVVELADHGYDIVHSSVTYALPEHVEELVLTGSGVVDGTGNVLDNRLVGNGKNNILAGGDGHDWIDGLGGIDTMIGGLGDDTYVVDTGSDVVLELEGEGIDTVMSTVSLTLAAHLENLTLIGTANRNGTGNGADNVLLGNAANNVLTGQAGNDRLDGGAGNDTLRGGTGADDYVFGRGWGSDTVQENDATSGVVDRVLLQSGILLSDTSFARNGNNLEMRLSGSADLLVVKDWYLGSRYQVEQFVYADGTVLPGTAISAEASTPSASDRVSDAMRRPTLPGLAAGRLPARLAGALQARRGAIAAVGDGERLRPALGDASLERQLASLVQSMAAWNAGGAMDAPSRPQPLPCRQACAEQFLL